MKILLCLNNDIYCTLALKLLFSDLKNHEAKIYFSKKVGKRLKIKDLQDLNSFETKNVFNDFDFIEDSGRKFISLKNSSHKIEIIDFININQDGLEHLKLWKPELIISIRFGQIFKQEIIDLPKHGILNLHSGILPNYRGIMATFWTMLDGAKQIGTSLHFIQDSGIDTGEIIDVFYFGVDVTKPLIWHISQLYLGGVKLIKETISKLENSMDVKSYKQDESQARYFSYPLQDEIDEFKKSYFLL